MNVLIISSSSKDIDPYYLSITRSIASFLASNECDLVFGASSSSMMGICYEEFVDHNRNIYSFTTKKYESDLENLNNSKKYLRENTFDMKKDMFDNSDLIVCLPGGVGTLSELLSYIEEKRSNNRDVPIIIYDENKFYEKFLSFLDDLYKEKFVGYSIFETFDITKNREEFEKKFYEIERVKKWKI